MHIRPEVLPFLLATWVVAAAILAVGRLVAHLSWTISSLCAGGILMVLSGYFLYFFRDPHRPPPADPATVVAAADGVVAKITRLHHQQFRDAAKFSALPETAVARFLESDTVLRLSIFLSLFDGHVNRAPITGNSTFLGYFPGKHFFTFQEKSSDLNQHNAILIQNDRTLCLVTQIVGPVCRRVVYWPAHDRTVPLAAGDRIGMMKFGSRLDMYFPDRDVAVTVKEGDRVVAGITPMARLVKKVE